MDKYGCFECNERDYRLISYFLHTRKNIVFTLNVDNETCLVINLSVGFAPFYVGFGGYGNKIPRNSFLCGVLYRGFYFFEFCEKTRYENYITEKFGYESEKMADVIGLTAIINGVNFWYQKGLDAILGASLLRETEDMLKNGESNVV